MKGRIIGLVIVVGLILGGFWVDRNRAAARSVLSGTFESQPSRLAPKISGRISRILVKEGDLVRKGQALVEVSAPEIVSQAEAGEALAEQAQAREAEVRNGTRREEIERQQAAVAEARAALAKLQRGPLPEDIRAAEQRARAAYAQLQIAQRGPSDEEKARLRQELKAAQSNLELAQIQRDRKKTLWEQGAVARVEYDLAQNQYETALTRRDQAALALQRALKGSPAEEVRAAEAEYRAAQAAAASVRKTVRPEDLQVATARLNQAQAALQELVNGSRREQVEQTRAASQAARAQAQASAASAAERTVFAPQDGIVERILVADGDLVGPAAPVVQFSNPRDIWLRIYLPEKDLAAVKVGDSVALRVDGIDGTIAGVVESIATQGEFTPANLQTPEERGKQVFAVRIRLKNPDTRVKAGQAATVKQLGGLKF